MRTSEQSTSKRAPRWARVHSPFLLDERAHAFDGSGGGEQADFTRACDGRHVHRVKAERLPKHVLHTPKERTEEGHAERWAQRVTEIGALRNDACAVGEKLK